MQRLLIITAIAALTLSLFAESNPLNDYFDHPTSQTFTAAYNACADSLAKDPARVSYRILQANLATMESDRLTETVYPLADSLDAGGTFQFANLLLAQNKFAEAIGRYQGLNDAYPAWSCPWRHKGQALYELKRFKEAEASLQQAIVTNLEHYDAYVWMARTQYQLKKYRPALKNLETALALNPEAEESPDEVISQDSIHALHEALLAKTGKK
jgi:tetratricopeptide (TPR) repeat protein